MSYHFELKTVGDYVRYAASSFNEAGLYYGHGTDNAWDEAIALIVPALHLPQNTNPAILNSRLTRPECEKLAELIDKRIDARIPVPYLTHQAWFAGMIFYVDERVLIPRSPIAELIEEHFEPWVNPDEVHHILDLCTGSGCIAVACAKAFPNAQIDASDISADAMNVAKMNVLRHHVEQQVELYISDLFKNLPAKKYDIIVSNPPYVSQEEMSSLPLEYTHEPTLGLSAGEKGLDFVTKILIKASEHLKPNGILVVEVGNSEIHLIEKFPSIPFLWIEFTRSEGGVFLLTAEQLQKHKATLSKG